MASQAPVPRCPECHIGFTDVEGRSAHRRFADHIGLEHLFKCKECDLNFISIPHWKFHINYVHDIPCGACGSFCEFKCAEKLAKIMMNDENMNQGRAKMIKSIEEEVIQESMNKNGINMELKKRLQAAIISLDRGKNEESLNEICSLAYLPGWAMPRLPHNPNRNAV